MAPKATPKPFTAVEILDFQIKIMTTANRLLATGQVTTDQYGKFMALVSVLADLFLQVDKAAHAK